MTRRFDLWNALGWIMLVFAILLGAAGYVGLLVRWPLAGGLLTSHGLLALAVWWLTGRNLRAELEAVRQRLATYNASETFEALGEVVDPEPPEWMDQSGYRRPCNNCGKPAVFAWETDGFPFAACNTCVSLWFEDGLPGHVVRLADERPPVHDFPETTVDMGGYTVTGPACESCGHPALLRWTGTEWVALCHDCYEALCAMVEDRGAALNDWAEQVRSPGPVEDDTPQPSGERID